MKQTAAQKRLPPLIAAMVVIATAAVALIPKLSESRNTVAASAGNGAENGGLALRTDDIGRSAGFFDYDADGTTAEVFAVQASDGTLHLALNTCQVWNGSPY